MEKVCLLQNHKLLKRKQCRKRRTARQNYFRHKLGLPLRVQLLALQIHGVLGYSPTIKQERLPTVKALVCCRVAKALECSPIIKVQGCSPVVQALGYLLAVKARGYPPTAKALGYFPMAKAQDYSPTVKAQDYSPTVKALGSSPTIKPPSYLVSVILT